MASDNIAGISGGFLSTPLRHESPKTKLNRSIRIPAEWEPHACCWMAWAPKSGWGNLNDVKRELSRVIRTISRYEPVRLLAPRGVNWREARGEFSGCSNIEVIEAPIHDIWLRDIAPTFAIRESGKAREIVAIDWNFNGWGCEDKVTRDGRRPAELVAEIAGTKCVRAKFRAEGGALIFDGRGGAVTTRSCLLNPNRNPVGHEVDRQRLIEDDLRRFGIGRVIWLEGDPAEPVTSGHVDGYVLLTPGRGALIEVVDDPDSNAPMWRDHDIDILKCCKDGPGNRLKIETVAAPRYRYWKGRSEYFAPCYMNVYLANGAVIGAKFGDPERDQMASCALKAAFPEREVILLEINHLAEGGGGVHCLTQPMPIIEERSAQKRKEA